MKKRVFCLILTALMMTGALPATAFAEGAEETPAVEAAADEALPAEEETAAPDEVLPAETETIAPDETLPAETETTAPEEALPAEEEAAAPDEALPGGRGARLHRRRRCSRLRRERDERHLPNH